MLTSFLEELSQKKKLLWWKIIATDHEKDEWFFPYVFGLVIKSCPFTASTK